jgi:protein involved in polysaccharide export with SLBB domain
MLLITTLFALLSFGGPQTAAPAEYVAGPQDVLSIVVFSEEDLKKTVALDADGTFDFPYVYF